MKSISIAANSGLHDYEIADIYIYKLQPSEYFFKEDNSPGGTIFITCSKFY